MRPSTTAARALCAYLALGLALGSCTSDPKDQAPDAAASTRSDIAGAAADADAVADADASRQAPDDPLHVQTHAGPVIGIASSDARLFRAIPYAAPPLGTLRFAPPQPPDAWSTPPPTEPVACPQLGTDGSVVGVEDCLKLDVWAPLQVPSEKVQVPSEQLPVLVWIHGGGFTAGSGYLFDAFLQTRDAIVVAINYRLGPLGFLAHPALSAIGSGTSGNYAIEDQRLALQWVRDNIAAFGGDPKNVTIFGESAGGSAVCAHLWSKQSAGLFQRAIIESGALCGRESRTLAQGEAQGEQLAEVVGCNAVADPVACLRALPPEPLLNALTPRTVISAGAVWGPLQDGIEFEHALPDTLASGDFNLVPTIIGANANEGIAFLGGLETMTEAEYVQRVHDSPFFGTHAEALLEMYPVSDYETPQAAYGALVGHRVFNCPARRTARAIAAAGGEAYVYWFNQGPSLHASELGFLFGLGTTDGEVLVAEAMKDAWAQLARTGDPNSGERPAWPRFATDSDQHFVFSDPLAVGSKLLQAQCDLWDQLEP